MRDGMQGFWLDLRETRKRNVWMRLWRAAFLIFATMLSLTAVAQSQPERLTADAKLPVRAHETATLAE